MSRRRRNRLNTPAGWALGVLLILDYLIGTAALVVLLAGLTAVAVAVFVWRRRRDAAELTAVGNPTVLYRHYLLNRPDIHWLLDGSPIYYGISNRYDLRCAQHADDSWWWPLIDPARSTCQTWPNRLAAERAEAAAIAADCPPGNTQHNGQWRAQYSRRLALMQLALALTPTLERTA